MAIGYTGKILYVNLSTQSILIEELGDIFYRTYMGGPGIGLYYLLKNMTVGVDSLGPDNLLIIAPGLLTGLLSHCVPHYTVCAKLPLTGTFGKSAVGGWLGSEIKSAGFDAIIFRGRADKPVYLWVHNGEVEIKDASNLWGLESGLVDESIKCELGIKQVRIAQIGPDGENLFPYACIVNELSYSDRGKGIGAVMGSKNLKAIAVYGTEKVKVADSARLQSITHWAAHEVRLHHLSSISHSKGTPQVIAVNKVAGPLCTCNRNQGRAQHDPFFVPNKPIGFSNGASLGILRGSMGKELLWERVRLILYTNFLGFAYEALGVCMLGYIARGIIPLKKLIEKTEAVTGWETSLWELMKVGERLNSMAQVFNCNEGFGSQHDRLPSRFYEPLLSELNRGKLGASNNNFREAAKLYYEMAGWDAQGIPEKGKLLELGLNWLTTQ